MCMDVGGRCIFDMSFVQNIKLGGTACPLVSLLDLETGSHKPPVFVLE